MKTLDLSLCIEDVETLKRARDALKANQFQADDELRVDLADLLESMLEDWED